MRPEQQYLVSGRTDKQMGREFQSITFTIKNKLRHLSGIPLHIIKRLVQENDIKIEKNKAAI